MVTQVEYTAVLDLTQPKLYYGEFSMKFHFANPDGLDFLPVDFKGDNIHSLTINDNVLPSIGAVEWKQDKLFIPCNLLSTSSPNTVSLTYTNNYSTTSLGLYKYVDPKDNKVYVYTDLEPFHCHTFLPVFDQPSIKATIEFTLITPQSWVALSNYPKSDTTELADEQSNVFIRTSFAKTPRISTYLYAVAAGEYSYYTDEATYTWNNETKTLPLGLYCRESLKQYIDHEDWFAKTKYTVQRLVSYFDYDFPFAKYDNIFVPNYNMGAMENVGLVTFNELYIQQTPVKLHSMNLRMYNTVIHEMIHMWFGNLVTMRWWDDLWLNEAFATFLAFVVQNDWPWREELGTPWLNFNQRKSFAYNLDCLSTSHAVASESKTTEEAEDSFDSITYGKGSSMLKQLYYNVGDTQFRDGLRNYFKKYEWGTTEREDFINVLAQTCTDFDVKDFCKEWICSIGLNTVDLDYSDSALTISQGVANLKFPTLRNFKVEVKLFYVSGSEEVVSIHVANAEQTVYPLSAPLKGLIFNYDDHVYIRYYPKDKDLDFIISNMPQISKLDLANTDLYVMESVKACKLKVKPSIEYYLKRCIDEEDSKVLLTLLSNVSSLLGSYIKDETEKNNYRDRALEIVKLKLDAEQDVQNKKPLFATYKSFFYSEYHYTQLKQIFTKEIEFPYYTLGDADFNSMFNQLINNKYFNKDRQSLLDKLHQYIGETNEFKKSKIRLFVVDLSEEDKTALYNALSLRDKDNTDKKYRELVAEYDQHDYSQACSGLVTKENVKTEFAKKLTTEWLWADVTTVACNMQQRKFKEFYFNLISYEYLDHSLLQRVGDLIKKNEAEKIDNSVLMKCLQNSYERMENTLQVIKFNN